METVEMTRDELDKAITQIIDPEPTEIGDPTNFTCSEGGHWHWCSIFGIEMWWSVFHPTKDMNSAWQLVRAARALGYEFYFSADFKIMKPFDSRFARKDHERAIAHGVTEMDAICLSWYELATGTRVTLIEDSP